MSNDRPKILFAAGGTGGHLFPALAIADEIKKFRPDADILFVGTKRKIEARVVPQRGYKFKTIGISGFQRQFRLSNLFFPIKVLVSVVQSFFLIKKFRPNVVVGTGGYVSGPVLIVASLRRIPFVLHESNSYPGVTTRLLAHRAARVYIAFDATNRWLKRLDNVELTGTPTRVSLGTVSAEKGRKAFGLNPKQKTILVFGGSLGAASINDAVLELVDNLVRKKIQLIWQTGESDFERVRSRLGKKLVGWIGPFIDNMESAYAAADIVISRAGATTIAELTRLGKPAILVPYPHAAADHQTVNARVVADAGAAVMIVDRDASKKLRDELFRLLEDKRRRVKMSAASKRLGHPQAGKELAKKILALAS